MPSSRWSLYVQAVVLRFLAQIGMYLAKLVPPRVPPPAFTRSIPTTVSARSGSIGVSFYVPKDWRSRKQREEQKFPVIVNFHGGGFTIGTSTDDGRWAAALVEQVGAIVASVDYRLAPEYPFPTAVEDGVDAVKYVYDHAEELHIDVDKIGVSGFSAGGNMCFTVPLMLNELIRSSTGSSGKASSAILDNKSSKSASSNASEVKPGPTINAIAAFYPPTDYSLTRAQRLSTLIRKEKQLSPVLYRLFDESYMYPPNMDLTSPFLSPLRAPTDMLEGLPQDILIYTCEWDILCAEGKRMSDCLEEMGKSVVYKRIDAVRHGFDKYPARELHPAIAENYATACRELKRIFKT